jgi:hypothetical protein
MELDAAIEPPSRPLGTGPPASQDWLSRTPEA